MDHECKGGGKSREGDRAVRFRAQRRLMEEDNAAYEWASIRITVAESEAHPSRGCGSRLRGNEDEGDGHSIAHADSGDRNRV